MYADDILILCETQSQIRKCVQIIEEWSQQNGMELNKNKSGIVVFAPRRAKVIPLMEVETYLNKKGETVRREWIYIQKDISGIPIMTILELILT